MELLLNEWVSIYCSSPILSSQRFMHRIPVLQTKPLRLKEVQRASQLQTQDLNEFTSFYSSGSNLISLTQERGDPKKCPVNPPLLQPLPHESFVLLFTRYLQITRQLLNTNISTSWFTEAAVRGLSDGNCRILKLGAGSRCRGTQQGVDSGAT